MLIIRVINFELVQPIRTRYVNVTDRLTDGQTVKTQSDAAVVFVILECEL